MTQHKPIGIYAHIINFFISKLEQGIVPWLEPWTKQGIPENLLTSMPYAGINTLHLASLGYSENYFLTFAELKSLGATIKKNETGHPVIIKEEFIEVENDETLAMVSQIIVFNIAQCDGIPPELVPSIEPPTNPQGMCRELIKDMANKPTIRHQGDKVYYNSKLDLLLMPIMKCFNGDIDLYYATLIRELINSTGHITRLNRMEVTEEGNLDLKELTAELGLWLLASLTGIPIQHNNDKEYCERWIARLSENYRLLFDASLQAQYAIGYILNVEKELNMRFEIQQIIPTI